LKYDKKVLVVRNTSILQHYKTLLHTKVPKFSGGGGDDELPWELLQLEAFEMNEIRLDDRTESLRSEYVAWQPSRIASVAATDEVIRLQRNA